MIADSYVVKYLLQNTQTNAIIWDRREGGGYFADISPGTENHTRIMVYRIQAMGTGELVCIDFILRALFKANRSYRASLQEPMRKPFRKIYETEDEQQLAGLMKELLTTIGRQCAARDTKGLAEEEQTKQEIYQKLISARSE